MMIGSRVRTVEELAALPTLSIIIYDGDETSSATVALSAPWQKTRSGWRTWSGEGAVSDTDMAATPATPADFAYKVIWMPSVKCNATEGCLTWVQGDIRCSQHRPAEPRYGRGRY